MYISISEDGRIYASTDVEEFAEGMTEFEFPEDFDFSKQNEYRIVDGELIHDPILPSKEEQLAELRCQIHATDSDVLEFYEYSMKGMDIPSSEVSRYAQALKTRAQARKKIAELEAQGGD